VQDLAEVDGKILACASSETPQISDRNRLRHQADSGHRGKGQRTLHDRGVANEGHVTPTGTRIETDNTKHLGQLPHGIDATIVEDRVCKRIGDAESKSVHKASSRLALNSGVYANTTDSPAA
jgi:hypothetical protein